MVKPAHKPSEAIAAVVEAGRTVNVTDLAEELLAAFGGAKRFAGKYFQEFEGAKSGSISRSKMLDGVLRVIAQASAQNKDRQGDVSQLSDEELALEAVRLLESKGVGGAQAEAR